MTNRTRCLTAALLVIWVTAGHGEPGGISGPLVRSEINPSYFFDGNSKAVYLTGSHTWNTLVDMGDEYPPNPFDFAAWLNFLAAHNHNFIRLYTWEVPHPRSERYERRIFVAPLPWARTGPGLDSMSQPKFDLTKRDPEYFARLRRRISMAADAGIYVSVMLFEGWAVQFAPGRQSHPFLKENNINGVDAGDPISIHTLANPEITALQEAHIRNVVDTVNEFDNVLYEIVNESGAYSTEWQNYMIRYLRSYQARKPNQHPVGMTFQYKGGLNEILMESDADWISPGPDSGRYIDDPRPSGGTKIIVPDTDHLGGSAFGDRRWVWKSFARGLNPIFMDRYEPPDSVTGRRYQQARQVRAAMGLTRLFAQRVDLSSMMPRPELGSSGFVLAGPDEVVIYQPAERPEYVDLRNADGVFEVEWFNPRTGEILRGDPVTAGSKVRLIRPTFDEDLVIYLRRRTHRRSMSAAEFEGRAKQIIESSHRLASRSITGEFGRRIAGLQREHGYVFGILLGSGFLVGVIVSIATVGLTKRLSSRSS